MRAHWEALPEDLSAWFVTSAPMKCSVPWGPQDASLHRLRPAQPLLLQGRQRSSGLDHTYGLPVLLTKQQLLAVEKLIPVVFLPRPLNPSPCMAMAPTCASVCGGSRYAPRLLAAAIASVDPLAAPAQQPRGGGGDLTSSCFFKDAGRPAMRCCDPNEF